MVGWESLQAESIARGKRVEVGGRGGWVDRGRGEGRGGRGDGDGEEGRRGAGDL